MGEFTKAQDEEIQRILRGRQPGGGVLAGTNDGPILDTFDAGLLAVAIEDELVRCAERSWTKVTLTMDVRDAMLLARYLRKGPTKLIKR